MNEGERKLNLIHREQIYEYSRGSSEWTDYYDLNEKFYTIFNSDENEDDVVERKWKSVLSFWWKSKFNWCLIREITFWMRSLFAVHHSRCEWRSVFSLLFTIKWLVWPLFCCEYIVIRWDDKWSATTAMTVIISFIHD